MCWKKTVTDCKETLACFSHSEYESRWRSSCFSTSFFKRERNDLLLNSHYGLKLRKTHCIHSHSNLFFIINTLQTKSIGDLQLYWLIHVCVYYQNLNISLHSGKLNEGLNAIILTLHRHILGVQYIIFLPNHFVLLI